MCVYICMYVYVYRKEWENVPMTLNQCYGLYKYSTYLHASSLYILKQWCKMIKMKFEKENKSWGRAQAH